MFTSRLGGDSGNSVKSSTGRRRTRAQVVQLEAQILDVLTADHPQSVRHVFYRLTDPRLPEPVEKSDQGYQQLQKRMVAMRRAGRLPYHWITDATRRGFHVSTFKHGGELITQFAALYRADLWRFTGTYVEVWCESRSIAGVIEDDCDELAVSLYPCGGFPSLSLVFEAAQEINRTLADSPIRRAVVLYVGDFDPAGLTIDRTTERELREHLSEGIELEFRRIAINADQIATYGLPTKPRKATDRRRPDIQETVEAEAMPAGELRRILRARIEAYLPEGALAATKAAEESERAGLRTLGIWAGVHGIKESINRMGGEI